MASPFSQEEFSQDTNIPLGGFEATVPDTLSHIMGVHFHELVGNARDTELMVTSFLQPTPDFVLGAEQRLLLVPLLCQSGKAGCETEAPFTEQGYVLVLEEL